MSYVSLAVCMLLCRILSWIAAFSQLGRGLRDDAVIFVCISGVLTTFQVKLYSSCSIQLSVWHLLYSMCTTHSAQGTQIYRLVCTWYTELKEVLSFDVFYCTNQLHTIPVYGVSKMCTGLCCNSGICVYRLSPLWTAAPPASNSIKIHASQSISVLGLYLCIHVRTNYDWPRGACLWWIYTCQTVQTSQRGSLLS